MNHRIEALRAGRTEQTGVTIDTVTEQLQQAYELAMANGQLSAAVAATMGLAKLHGLFKSRAEVQARNFVVSDSPAGRDQLEMEPKTPLTEAEWMVEYGVSAN